MENSTQEMPSILRYDDLPPEIRILVTLATIKQSWHEEDRMVLPPLDYRLGLLCRKTRGDFAAALLCISWIQVTVMYSTDDESVVDAKVIEKAIHANFPSALPSTQHCHARNRAKKPVLSLTLRIGLAFTNRAPKEVKYLIPFDQRELCGIGRLVTVQQHAAQLTHLELVTPPSHSTRSLQHELLPLIALVRNCAKEQDLATDRKPEYVLGLDEYHTKLLEAMMVTEGFYANECIVWLEEIIQFAEYMYSISLGHGERACDEATRMLDAPRWSPGRLERVPQIVQDANRPDSNQAAFLMCKLALLSLQKQNEQWEKVYQADMTYKELGRRQHVFENRARDAMRYIGLHGHDRELVHIQAGMSYYNLARLISRHFPWKQAEFMNAMREAGIHFQSGALISPASSQVHTLLREINEILELMGSQPVEKEDTEAKLNKTGGVKEYIPNFVRQIWNGVGRFRGVRGLRTRTILRPEQQHYPHNWQYFVQQWMADG